MWIPITHIGVVISARDGGANGKVMMFEVE